MDEQSLKFFKMATASALGILILILITAIIIAFYTASDTDAYQAPSVTNTYATVPTQTQWVPLDSTRYQKQEEKQYTTENINVPPCTDPCQIRVEYSNQYFLPYPTYKYKDRFYYEDYPVYPHYTYQHYPNNQRFFHHRIIENNYGY